MNKGRYSSRPVGYGKPPKHWQFSKGQSGNPNGRPKEKSVDATGLSELLNSQVNVKVGDKTCKMSAFEADVRKIAASALKGDIRSIIRFIKLCEEYSIIELTNTTSGGVIQAPYGVDFHDWLDSVTELVPINEE